MSRCWAASSTFLRRSGVQLPLLAGRRTPRNWPADVVRPHPLEAVGELWSYEGAAGLRLPMLIRKFRDQQFGRQCVVRVDEGVPVDERVIGILRVGVVPMKILEDAAGKRTAPDEPATPPCPGGAERLDRLARCLACVTRWPTGRGRFRRLLCLAWLTDSPRRPTPTGRDWW